MTKEFHCIKVCSDCCIERQYFPSIEYGKIGVFLLPDEKLKIEALAAKMHLKIKILPRIGTGEFSSPGPSKVIGFQLMGYDKGNYCPFLDIKSHKRTVHGGFLCTIYESRPLACIAYPAIQNYKSKVELDCHCRFACKDSIYANKNYLANEILALRTIQKSTEISANSIIWRYATQIGEEKYSNVFLPRGWYMQN